MNKKEIVIEKARELFTKYGYKKVSMDEIAHASNVTKKTIYTYFKDKEELFKYFIQEELEHIKKEMESYEKSNLPLIEIVAKTIYNTLKHRKNSVLFNNLKNEPKSNQNDTFLKLYDDEILSYIETKIKKEIKKKNIKKCDTHLTAFIIYKIYIAVMFQYDQDLDEEKITKEITSILKDGLFNKEGEKK